MADRTRQLETLLLYATLTGPLDRNPTTELDRILNKYRLKYRTYYVDFDVDDGFVKLPGMFASDFGDEIGVYATLIDPKFNEFEVLVKMFNGGFYLTKGWKSLRDFYGITLGVWITMIWLGSGRFNIIIKDRFGRSITYPKFDIPMKFVIDKSDVPNLVGNHVAPSAWHHDVTNFKFNYEKHLDDYDVTSGFLVLPYEGFAQFTLDRSTTQLTLVDDCGNEWQCILIYGTVPDRHYKIGGGWKRMIAARRITERTRILLGAPVLLSNETLYIGVRRD